MKWLLPLVVGAVCAGTPPWEKAGVPLGQKVYRENCAVCHDIDKDQKHTRKIGPSLNRLFKNSRLPLSKSRPNRDYVVVRVRYGGQIMPAFMKRIDERQMAALLAYLESR